MKIFNRIPAWVRHFPYELDKEALTWLAKSSRGKFDKPREMNFVLCDFSDDESIENAISQIEQAGWKCLTVPQSDSSGKTVIEAQKMGYSLTQDAYMADSAFFMRIADLYHVGYDGWYAGS